MARIGMNERLLILNIGRLGDTILCNSILEAAFSSYPQVDYLCGKNNAGLMRCESRLGKVLVFENTFSGFSSVLNQALLHRYDAIIGLKECYSSTNLFLARLFRSPLKTGWNGNYLKPFHRDVRGIYSPAIHKVEMMRRIGDLAELKPAEYRPHLTVPPSSIEWFRKTYTGYVPFIFVNISATHPNRVWPVEKWARYIQGCGFAQERILVNGVPTDQEMVRKLSQSLPRATAFAPRHFLDVAAAVSDARLVLSVDTGVVHACSALNRPLIAFYRADRPGPMPLSDEQLVIQPTNSDKVADIDPDQAIRQTLGYKGAIDLLR